MRPLCNFFKDLYTLILLILQIGIRFHVIVPSATYVIFKCMFQSLPTSKSFFVCCTGRSPNTKRLNLEAVGVELDRIGAVKV